MLKKIKQDLRWHAISRALARKLERDNRACREGRGARLTEEQAHRTRMHQFHASQRSEGLVLAFTIALIFTIVAAGVIAVQVTEGTACASQ